MDGWQRQGWCPPPASGGSAASGGAGGSSSTRGGGPIGGTLPPQQPPVPSSSYWFKFTLYLHQGAFLAGALGQTVILLANWHRVANNAARAYMVAVALISQMAAFVSLRWPRIYWERR